jgi:hypothetical protein
MQVQFWYGTTLIGTHTKLLVPPRVGETLRLRAHDSEFKDYLAERVEWVLDLFPIDSNPIVKVHCVEL